MCKKIFGTVLMAAIAVAAGWNISQNENEMNLSDLALNNIEALAFEENAGGLYCQWDGTNRYCTRSASGPVCLLITSC